mmetsp:Transcript_26960/g.64347  ORF Transcript_26960/g.64347 Transcript_26960/m.64347 type:complete len:1026 (-) Transcript_26960:36-3113(-)
MRLSFSAWTSSSTVTAAAAAAAVAIIVIHSNAVLLVEGFSMSSPTSSSTKWDSLLNNRSSNHLYHRRVKPRLPAVTNDSCENDQDDDDDDANGKISMPPQQSSQLPPPPLSSQQQQHPPQRMRRIYHSPSFNNDSNNRTRNFRNQHGNSNGNGHPHSQRQRHRHGHVSSYLSSRKYVNNNSNSAAAAGRRNNAKGGSGGTDFHHHRQQWLKHATNDILKTKPGTLVKGKWHELVSLVKANAKYAKIDPLNTPPTMERLVQRLVDEKHVGRNTEVIIDIEIYNLVLDAWCCQALFLRRSNNNHHHKNSKRTNGQNNNQQQHQSSSSSSAKVMASQRAREMLVLLQENYEKQQQQQLQLQLLQEEQEQGGQNQDYSELSTSATPKMMVVQPDEDSFMMVFDAVLKVEGPNVARRVLAWMEFIYKKGRNSRARPGRRYYVKLLESYADKGMPELAEAFLRHMMHETSLENVDTWCYNVALKAWSRQRSGGRTAAEHVDRLLDQMTAPKDIITYSTAMSAWAKSGMKTHAVARVEDLLMKMEQDGLEPNHVVVNVMMRAWILSRNPNASQRTAELLEYLESPNSTARPDLMTYNNHIQALTLSPNNAKEAEELLKSLIERSKNGETYLRPNTYSFNVVINAWSESRDYEAAWNAVKLLRQMIYRKDCPNPDTFSFNQVLKALSRSRRPQSARLAEQLLTTMEEGCGTKLFKNAKPDVASYTSTIVALSRSNEANAAERGEAVLSKARAANVKPTTHMYNALITLWGKAGRGTYGARRAEQLLREMKARGVTPNTISYNTVMDSWSRSGTRCCGNKAEGYLELLLSDKSVKPDKVSFNTCLNALSRSHNQGKAQRALRLLRRMIRLFESGQTGARPDVVSYTSVLNAAKRSNRSIDQTQRVRNLYTARHTLHELRKSRWDHPNEHSYTTFIQACYGLSDDGGVFREILEDVWELCCQDGQVGPQVLSVVNRIAPPDFVEKHNLDGVTWEELPLSWRRHVKISPPRRERPNRFPSKLEKNMRLSKYNSPSC